VALSQEATGSMPNPLTFSCGLAFHAVLRVGAGRLDSFRKSPACGKRSPLTASFLKHVDAQTILGMAAIDQAMRDSGLPVDSPMRNLGRWGVIGAPRFLGRAGLTPVIANFHLEGAWGVSPHHVPHRSLHSFSGTVSQAFGMQGPNFGAGGGPGCEIEGLLAAAATLASSDLPGLWVLITRVEPELPPVNGCHIDPQSSVEAVALGLVPLVEGCPLQMDLTHGLPAQEAIEGVEPFDLDALAAMLRRLEEGHETSAALGAVGRLTLRPARKTLAGPHAIERFPSRSVLPVETERRISS
jgi:hypothetical protein